MHPCIHAAMHPCIHPSIHPSIRQWRLIGNSYKQDDPSSVNCQCFSEGHVQITFKFGGFPFAAPGWAVCSFCWSFGIASHRNMLARSTFEISSSTLRWPPGCWRVALLGTWGWPPQRSFIVYRYSISGDYPDFITHEMMINPCLYIYICVCVYVCVCVNPRSTRTIFLMVSAIAFSILVEISLPCGTVQKVWASSHKSIPGWTTLCWTVIISVRPALYPKNHNSLCHWRKAMVTLWWTNIAMENGHL